MDRKSTFLILCAGGLTSSLVGIAQAATILPINPFSNEKNYETWAPGSILGMTSNDDGEIVFTAQASSATARININGIMVVPEPSSAGLLGLGLATLMFRRRR